MSYCFDVIILRKKLNKIFLPVSYMYASSLAQRGSYFIMNQFYWATNYKWIFFILKNNLFNKRVSHKFRGHSFHYEGFHFFFVNEHIFLTFPRAVIAKKNA